MDRTPDHDQHMLEGTLAERILSASRSARVREAVLKEVVLKMASEVDAAKAEVAEGVALLREKHGYRATGLEWCDRRDAFLSRHPAPSPSADGGGPDES